MNKKAFTLIELLAVIVILAIISLIAVPIVINIINDSKENSEKRSVELYMKMVESTLTNQNLKNKYNPSICKIQINGNLICDDNNNIELEIKVKGKKPSGGVINISNGKIISYSYVKIENSFYKKNENESIKKSKGYQELKYLESTGNQAINTNIYIKNTDIVEVVLEDLEFNKNYENWFGTIDNQFGLNRKNGKNLIGLELNGNVTRFNLDIFADETTILIDIPEGKIIFNENTVFNFQKYNFVETTYSVYLFSKLRNITASTSSGGAIYDVPGSFKLYSFSVKDSVTDRYRYNLIPVLDEDYVACMYDTVNQNFYYNETKTNFLYKK